MQQEYLRESAVDALRLTPWMSGNVFRVQRRWPVMPVTSTFLRHVLNPFAPGARYPELTNVYNALEAQNIFNASRWPASYEV